MQGKLAGHRLRNAYQTSWYQMVMGHYLVQGWKRIDKRLLISQVSKCRLHAKQGSSQNDPNSGLQTARASATWPNG